MKQSPPVKLGAVYLLIYIALLFFTIFVPVAELFTIFLLPLPFLVYSARYGVKPGVLLGSVGLLISSLLLPAITLPFAFIAVFGGLMTGTAVSQQLSPYETWARGTVGYVIGLVSTFLFIQFIFNINIVNEIRSVIQSSIQSSQEMIEAIGLTFGEEETAAVTEQMETLLDLLPVFLVVLGLLLAFITQWIGYKLINKMEKKELKFPPFRTFRLPIALIWIYFFAMLVTLLSGDDGGSVRLAAVNVTNLAGFLVALQGLAFVFYYVHKKKLSIAIPIIAIVTVVLFPWIGLYLLRILGIIDLGFSLRDRIEKKD